jgi:carboxymethylenebutenolidase
MAGERAGREIEIKIASEGGPVAAYVATPASGGGPGVVVIQEWWGLVDHILDVCDRLARAGFVALAPDLYRGEATSDPDVAGRLMMDLEIDRAAADLDAAIEALRRQDGVEGARVGAIGFCMGGQLALLAATRNDRVAACVDCYGVHPNVEIDPSGIDGAVLGIFAEHDDFIPLDTVRALEAKLRDAGVRSDFEIFAGTQHAFLNETRPEVHDATNAAKAWNKIQNFLNAELAKGGRS